MEKIEKYQTGLIFGGMLGGLVLGNIAFIRQSAANFVMPCLFVMLIGAFINIPLKDYKQALTNLKFSATTVLINFVWTPLLVWTLGKVFLAASPIMQLGFLMLMVTPCTDWYLVFTSVVKGNVPLSASVLPLNLLLQVILLPIYLLLFGGVSGSIGIDLKAMLLSIFSMLLLPFILAQIGKYILRKSQSPQRQNQILQFFGTLQTLLLALAILAMFAAKGQSLLGNLKVVAVLLIPIILFYMINFGLAQFIGKIYNYSYEDTASLTLTTIAKNSPMTLGVALVAFPNEPLIHLIMVIEPLIELPAMWIITRILLKIRGRKKLS